jgi:acyl carrier protein
MNDVQDRLARTIRDMFDVPTIQINRATTAADIEGWDSLTHINLIVAVEKEFGVRFTTAEVTALKNVGDLTDVVAKKLS